MRWTLTAFAYSYKDLARCLERKQEVLMIDSLVLLHKLKQK